jgi:hypothetical protein
VPHGLRHTAATLMLAEGWEVMIVAQLLGRQTVTTTKYLDELPGEVSVAINACSPTRLRSTKGVEFAEARSIRDQRIREECGYIAALPRRHRCAQAELERWTDQLRDSCRPRN